MEVTASTGTSPIHILIVEDSPTQAEHLRYLLEAKTFIVSWAQTGKGPWRFWKASPPTSSFPISLCPA